MERDTTAVMPQRVTIPGLAKKLVEARARAELSLEAVHQITGIGPVTVYRYECERRVPTLEQLYRLAAAYGCSVADLLPPAPPFATKKKRHRRRPKPDAGSV